MFCLILTFHHNGAFLYLLVCFDDGFRLGPQENSLEVLNYV